MFTVTKKISFCYGHRLLKHAGKRAFLHGHNAIAEIRCASDKLDRNEMVVDFGRITAALKHWIDAHLDHRMILNEKDPLVPLLKKQNEPFYAMRGDPTAEALARLIFEKAKAARLPVTQVLLWETPTASASYQYK